MSGRCSISRESKPTVNVPFLTLLLTVDLISHGIQNPQLDVDLVDLSGKRVLGRGNDGVSYYVTPR